MRDAAHEFLRGALRPSLPAILLALAVVLLLFALIPLLVTPTSVAGAEGRLWAAGPTDYDVFVTATLAGYSRGTRPREGVAVFGASAMREALMLDGSLARGISTVAGREVPVLDLLLPGQRLPLTAALVDMISVDFRGVIVIAVSPLKFATDLEDPVHRKALLRLATRNLTEETTGLGRPGWSGNFVLDNLDFFVARLPGYVLHLVYGPPERSSTMGYEGRAPDADLAVQLAGIRTALDSYPSRRDSNLDVLVQATREARASGRVRVLLVEAPHSPEMAVGVYDPEVYQEHIEWLSGVARESGLDYLVLDAEEGELPEDAWYDYVHLTDEAARRRLTTRLAKRIAALLTGEGR